MKPLNKNISISPGKQYFFSTIILFAFIMLLYQVQDLIGYETVSLILLLILFLLPLLGFEKGPIIVSAIISALAWDYYFIPPHFTMHIAKTEDGMMLFMFFIVALTNGILTSQLKEQKNRMIEKEWRTNSLFNLLKDLSGAKDIDEVIYKIVKQVSGIFGFESVIYFPADQNKLSREPHSAGNFIPDEMEWLAAESAYINRREAGRTTDTISGAYAIYFPIMKNDNVTCVIGIKIDDEIKQDFSGIDFLRTFINETGIFFEKQVATPNHTPEVYGIK